MTLTKRLDVAHLEQKVERLESQVRRASASSSSSDEDRIPTLNTELSSVNAPWPGIDHIDSAVSLGSSGEEFTGSIEQYKPEYHANDDVVETIDCPRETEVPEDNISVTLYRGNSTGIEIVRNLRRLCDSYVGFAINPEPSATKLAKALDRSFPLHYLSLDAMANVSLPSASQVRRWVDIAFTEAFSLWPFIDRQLFDFNMKRLFEQQNFGRARSDRDNLALAFAVLALGQRYDPDLIEIGGDCFETGNVRGYGKGLLPGRWV